MHVLLEFLYSVLLAAAVFAAINLGLSLAWLGNPRSIAFATQAKRVINTAPSGTTFTCKDHEVSATVYNARADEEHTQLIYRTNAIVSFLAWSGGSRSLVRMKRSASREMALHICCLILFVVPAIVVGIWLAIAVHWAWIFAVLLFLEWQIVASYMRTPMLVKWGFCTGLVAVVFFHRTGWFHYPLWVIYLYTGIWLALSPLAALWAAKSKD